MCSQTLHLYLWCYAFLVTVHCNRTYVAPWMPGMIGEELDLPLSPGSLMSSTPGQETGRLVLNGEEVIFRVVKGEPATLGEVPYQASFRRHVPGKNVYASFCGGTIVTERKIISSAHCFHVKSIWDSCCTSGRASHNHLKPLFALAGVTDTFEYYHGNDSSTYGQWRKISSALYPKSYKFPNLDICIVTVAKPFHFNDHVSGISYAVKDVEYSGTCLVSGFGRIGSNQISKHLRKARLRVLSKAQCAAVHGKDMHEYICTADDLADIGKGDSGGPLVCKNTGDENEKANGILVGIVCGKKMALTHGSFFIRVSAFSQFIQETLNSHCTSRRFCLSTLLICAFITLVS